MSYRFFPGPLKLAAGLFLLNLISGCAQRPLYSDTRAMLGTYVEVACEDRSAAPLAFAEIKRIEDLLSKYNPASEISRLNKLGRLAVSADTFYVIEKAKYFWEASSGAFDITVAPLLDLWGFTDKNYRKPQDSHIKAVLGLIGSDKIILDKNKNVVELKIPGMKLDLGAIAKGYAVDCAIKRLREKGIKNCLINAGGQIYCLGDKSGKPWKVAIRDPRNPGLLDKLELKDVAVATSGDYMQYFIKDERRYSHIMDPRKGYPADSGVASVTVIAPDGLTADALATAIVVLGEQGAKKLLEQFPAVKTYIKGGSHV